MFEKVNPQHPDKVADRIAGAIVDLCYTKSEWPKVAAEVLLGRKARLMEFDPHYADVIIARYEKLTGKKAERIN